MVTRLYGILWRWHFLAGLACSPVLLVVAITGGLYTFQPELERLASPALFEVSPRGARRPLDELVARLPEGCAPGSITIVPARDRSIEVGCAGSPARRVFLDPYDGEVLGTLAPDESFFGYVLRLHRQLWLGERGQLVVEWATSWLILLLGTGAYLWWPRGRQRGVWTLRRGAARGRRLRDLHAVSGIYVAPVVFVIAATGLFWTQLAGTERWRRIATDVVEDTWANPPRSSPVGHRIGYDQAIAASRLPLTMAQPAINVSIDAAPDAAYLVFGYEEDHTAPWRNQLVWIDAYSGATLRRLGWSDRTILGRVNDAGYAAHVGALLSLPGRLLWLGAAVGLAVLCVTGPWMWWKRRPRGKLGIPPAARRVRWPLLVALAALGWLLPTVGWTLLGMLAVELFTWVGRRVRRRG